MVIQRLRPPEKDKLKAHYFDRYGNSVEDGKILSSVGDQSREVQPGRCYETNAGAGTVTCTFPNSGLITNQLGVGMTLSFWATYPSFGGSVRTEQGNFSFTRVANDINQLIQFGYSGNNGGTSYSMQWQTRDESNNIYRLRITDNVTPKNQLNLWVFRMINHGDGTITKQIFIDNVLKLQETVPENVAGNPTINMNWEKTVGLGSTKLADIRYFKSALSDEDLLNLFNQKPLSANPIVWYKCDESAGNVSYDSSGNGLHGSISNATPSTFHTTQNKFSFQNETGYSVAANGALIPAKNKTLDVLNNPLEFRGQVAYNASLKQSNCINLDGVDDYVQLDQDIVIDKTKKYEISFRLFATTNNTALRYLFRGGDAYSLFNYIRYRSAKLYPYTTGGGYVQGAVDLHNRDVEIKFIFDPVTNILSQYVDGVFDGEGFVRTDNVYYDAISRISHGDLGVLGKIYNFKVKENDVLIHHYPMAEGGGTRIYDVVGGNHGTLTNSTLATAWGKQDVFHYNIMNDYIKGLRIENLAATFTPITIPANSNAIYDVTFIANGTEAVNLLGNSISYGAWLQFNGSNGRVELRYRTGATQYSHTQDFSNGIGANIIRVVAEVITSNNVRFTIYNLTTGVNVVNFSVQTGVFPVDAVFNCFGANGNIVSAVTIFKAKITVDGIVKLDVDFTKSPLLAATKIGQGITANLSTARNIFYYHQIADFEFQKAGRHHNGAETEIDFTSGIINDYSKDLPTNYKFGDTTIDFKEEEKNRENNLLIYSEAEVEEELKINNYIKK